MPFCNFCEQDKPPEAFHRDRSKKSGLTSKCASCKGKYSVDYRSRTDGARYQREWKAQNRVVHSGYMSRWVKRNPLKVAAHRAVRRAIKNGSLIRPATCESCGVVEVIESHHEDYGKPLIVQWLCRECHVAVHRKHTGAYK